MKYLAAYALLTLSGKKDISANDIKNLLGAANANIDEGDLNKLIETLRGKDVNKLIAEGVSKIGAVAGPAASGPSQPAVQQKKKQQPKKQAKKKEAPKVEEEEEDFGLGGGLFD